MENTQIRQLQNSLLDVLNASPVNMETKRLLLCVLAKDCELRANKLIEEENQTIEEKGELGNAESVC